VVVLANGKVAEQGKPEELGSRPGGLYAALLKSQVPTFT
jgi:ABC-type multidrug transport system fused ATPase/permease subunit